MSKRFGRNQKRRMREQLDRVEQRFNVALQNVANLESAYHRDTRMLRESIQKAEYRSKFCADALARFTYCGFLPPVTLATRDDPRLFQRIDTPSQLNINSPGDKVRFADARICTMQTTVDLTHLHSIVRRAPSGIDTILHLFIEGRGAFNGEWRYAISDRALAAGIPPTVRADICRHMADHLLTEAERYIAGCSRVG